MAGGRDSDRKFVKPKNKKSDHNLDKIQIFIRTEHHVILTSNFAPPFQTRMLHPFNYKIQDPPTQASHLDILNTFRQ